MRFNQAITATEIAPIVQGEYNGPTNLKLTGINEIHKVEKGDITFVDVPKYYKKALHSPASLILINDNVQPPEGKGIVICDDPFKAYNQLVKTYSPEQLIPEGNYTTGKNFQAGQNNHIFPGVFIGNNVKIGENCMIYPNVVIYDNTEIGSNVIIHSNTTIGSDAFYYKNREAGYDKLISCGRVIIEDDVEIGSNCTIDKGVSGITRIGKGSKLDNQVHLGHGVVLGSHCLLAAQVGIGGKTILEDRVILWGQVGINKDVRIPAGTEIYAQSGVAKTINEKGKYFGSPVMKAKEKMKELSFIKRLPELFR